MELAFLDVFKSLFDAFSADPLGTLTTGNAGDVFGLTIVILAAIGLIECFLGLKLLRLELLVFGFGAGFFLGNLIAGLEGVSSLLTEDWMKYVLMGVLGIVCTILAYRFLRLALTLGVAAASYFFLGPILGGMLPGKLIGKIVAVAIGLVIGLIAQKLLKAIVILVTTVLGSYLVAYALSGIAQKYVVRTEYMTVILLAIFFILGFTAQVKGARKHR